MATNLHDEVRDTAIHTYEELGTMAISNYDSSDTACLLITSVICDGGATACCWFLLWSLSWLSQQSCRHHSFNVGVAAAIKPVLD